MNLNFNDFQKQDISFDIHELQKAYNEILKIRDFSGPDGVSNFGAISLTQIPGDPDSIKGHKARGVFGRSLMDRVKRLYETKKLMKLLTQNLLKIIKTLTSKKYLMFYLLNINLAELEFY